MGITIATKDRRFTLKLDDDKSEEMFNNIVTKILTGGGYCPRPRNGTKGTGSEVEKDPSGASAAGAGRAGSDRRAARGRGRCPQCGNSGAGSIGKAEGVQRIPVPGVPALRKA